MAQPFIGNKITLVSVSQIRYEGILAAVNQAESTVSLQNVRMLGTEGRRGAGQQEILPNNQVYSFIEFRATDILELQVIDEAPPAFQDPAIVSRSPPVPAAPTGAPAAPAASSSQPAAPHVSPTLPAQQKAPTAIQRNPNQRKPTQQERQKAHEKAKAERLRLNQKQEQQKHQ